MKHWKLIGAVALSTALAAAAASAAQPALCAAPAGAHGCYASIQAAIDAANPGATIDVYPGNYSEVAADRSVATLGGPFQFGLFIDKDDLTIRGVDDKRKRITDWAKVKAWVSTNATNNFGPSGIFVQGDGVTLSALGIGDNAAGLNKTIEVIGDAFTLENSDVSNLQGSIYINDFRYDMAHGESHVRAYRIEGNNFQDGVSIDIASGAGVSGPVHGRIIRKNDFSNSYYWPSISFNGSGTGIPWFTYPVGGAVIQDNTFVNTFEVGTAPEDQELLLREGHIRARGQYDNSQFDWNQYFNANKFDKAYATGPKAPRDLREYTYTVPDDLCITGTCTFANRRIGALLEGEQEIALASDKIVAKPK